MAAKIFIDVKRVKDKIERFSYPKAKSLAVDKSREIIRERKREFLEAFDDHDVSNELRAGPGSNSGVDGVSGNLFSFLGFDAGSDPVGDLYSYLDSAIHLVSRNLQYNNSSKTFIAKMSLPTQEGIKKITDLKNYATNFNETGYGEGLSWAYAIERGIPGLDYYKYSTDPSQLGKGSRSGTGIQRKKPINEGASHKTRSYLTELLTILAKNSSFKF